MTNNGLKKRNRKQVIHHFQLKMFKTTKTVKLALPLRNTLYRLIRYNVLINLYYCTLYMFLKSQIVM